MLIFIIEGVLVLGMLVANHKFPLLFQASLEFPARCQIWPQSSQLELSPMIGKGIGMSSRKQIFTFLVSFLFNVRLR